MSDHLDAPGPVVLTAPPAPSGSPSDPGPNEFADGLFPDKNGLDSVSIGPPHGLAHLATDIADLYAFQKPDAGDGEDDSEEGEVPGKSILILTVNPLALAAKFETEAEYLIRVDTDGDHHEDITFSVTFSDSQDGGQTAKVRRITGGEEDEDSVLFRHAPVSLGKEAHISSREGYRFFAGLRSDPFFFDLIGFIDDLNFVNGDFFAKQNIYAIVLEVPNRALGRTPHTTSMWARTRIKDPAGEGMINNDNAARAAINTVFNHGEDKNKFSNLEPSQQPTGLLTDNKTTFAQSFFNTVKALTGNDAYATAIAAALLPDVLNYDYTKPANYAALNGRHLQDDVISFSLNLVSNGLIKTDNVPPHTDYLAHFPYVGNPH
jgi:hypothetical protein